MSSSDADEVVSRHTAGRKLFLIEDLSHQTFYQVTTEVQVKGKDMETRVPTAESAHLDQRDQELVRRDRCKQIFIKMILFHQQKIEHS